MPKRCNPTADDWKRLNPDKEGNVCRKGTFHVVVPRRLDCAPTKARMLRPTEKVDCMANNPKYRVVTVLVEMQRGSLVRGLKLQAVDGKKDGSIPEGEVVLLFDGPVVDKDAPDVVSKQNRTQWDLKYEEDGKAKALETTKITASNAAQLVNEVHLDDVNCYLKQYGRKSFALVVGFGANSDQNRCENVALLARRELKTYYGDEYHRQYELKPSIKAVCLAENKANYKERIQHKEEEGREALKRIYGESDPREIRRQRRRETA